MAIYQGDIGIHDIKLGSIDVFEIYQGSKLVYPENTEVTITFKLNVSGIVIINGYTPIISENNTKFVFTIPVKTDYTANITAEHYKSQTISGNSGYLPIAHNVELEWEQRFISYTVTFPTDGVKVLFDGIKKGVITNGKLVVLIDDTEAKDSYIVTFEGSKASIYTVDELTVDNINVPNSGGIYDLKSSTSAVKTNYKRKDYAPSTGSITKGSTYAGTWIETVVNLTASFTSSTTLGSISNNVLTIPNNESTNAKSGTLTVVFTLENSQTKEVSAALNQAAGAKVYTDWVLDLQTDGTTVNASGGTRTVTVNVARRTYKWNNIGTVYSETATPTFSISGSASLSGNQIKFTSNESVSARSATLTASYVGLSKTVTITQQAGAKVYSAWSAWTVSISASTQTIAASGGSSTITTNASRSRTWTWNGVGTTHTDTENATPTLSGSAGGFTLSGKTVTASNNTTTNSRSITITATSNNVSKSITITQSAGAKVYGNWSAWIVNISADKTSISATGGTATISTSASRTRSYTWNGVAGSGGTETGNGTPTLSKVSGSGNWTSPKVTYGNNTSTSGKSTVIRATIDSTTKDITISQSAGAKQYSSWSAWTVNISNSGNVAASGGSSNITTSASRTRTWTWNGVSGSGGTETGTGTPTLSKVSGAGSFANNKVTYSNNTSTSARSTVIRATMDSITKNTTVTQSAGAKTYSSWGAWSISLSANKTTIAAAGGNSTLSTSATRSRTWQWNGTGTTYTENASGSPTLSKVSGDATLSGSTVTYGNNTSTNAKSSVFRAIIDSTTKNITINQSAGEKVYTYQIIATVDTADRYFSYNTTIDVPYNNSQISSIFYFRVKYSYLWNNIGDVHTSMMFCTFDSYDIIISDNKPSHIDVYSNIALYGDYNNRYKLLLKISEPEYGTNQYTVEYQFNFKFTFDDGKERNGKFIFRYLVKEFTRRDSARFECINTINSNKVIIPNGTEEKTVYLNTSGNTDIFYFDKNDGKTLNFKMSINNTGYFILAIMHPLNINNKLNISLSDIVNNYADACRINNTNVTFTVSIFKNISTSGVVICSFNVTDKYGNVYKIIVSTL